MRILGFVVLWPGTLFFALLWAASPTSSTSVALCLASGLMAVGFSAPQARHARILGRAGAAGMLWVLAARMLSTPGEGMHVVRLPDEGLRWVNRLLPERDATLLAAHAMVRLRVLPRSDTKELVAALEDGYTRMERAQGETSTPAIATWLGMQRPQAFDAVVVDAMAQHPKVAVVFLHGWTGNFSIQCWQVSQAARAINAVTVCPSVGPMGDWWTDHGAQTLEQTIGWLKVHGITQFYLAGYSNGGVGAGAHAQRFAKDGLLGLIFISGVSMDAQMPAGVPCLVVQGDSDSMMRPAAARAFSRRWSKQVTYVGIASGHFALLDRHAQVGEAVAQWLRTHGGAG